MLTRARVKTASLLERGGHDCCRGGQVEPALSLARAEEFLGKLYTFLYLKFLFLILKGIYRHKSEK